MEACLPWQIGTNHLGAPAGRCHIPRDGLSGRPDASGDGNERTCIRRSCARRRARSRGCRCYRRIGRECREHLDGVAPGRCAVGLAGCRGGGERPVQGPESGLGRQRPVSDVGHPPREVRRDAGGRQRPRRHRDGEHGDDEVHGGRGVPGSVGELLPEPEHVAAGPRCLRPVRREDLRRSVLRGLARRHLPHRPLQQDARQGADKPRAVHRAGEDASARRTRRARSPRSTSREPTGTSR